MTLVSADAEKYEVFNVVKSEENLIQNRSESIFERF